MGQTSYKPLQVGSRLIGAYDRVRIDPMIVDKDGAVIIPDEVFVEAPVLLVSINADGTFDVQNPTGIARTVKWSAFRHHSVHRRQTMTTQTGLGTNGADPSPLPPIAGLVGDQTFEPVVEAADTAYTVEDAKNKLIILDTSGAQVDLTIQTPNAAHDGAQIVVQRRGANPARILCGAGITILGAGIYPINNDYDSIHLVYVQSYPPASSPELVII